MAEQLGNGNPGEEARVTVKREAIVHPARDGGASSGDVARPKFKPRAPQRRPAPHTGGSASGEAPAAAAAAAAAGGGRLERTACGA
ncbi:unnamed protein product, partial [Phaeothamnion confervicola]